MNVDGIGKEVWGELSATDAGTARVRRMDELVGDLVCRRERITMQLQEELGRRRIISRRDTIFRVSTTKVRGPSGLSTAVCTGGVQIGRIRLRQGQIEFDVPPEVAREIRDGVPADAVRWSSKEARERIEMLAKRVRKLPLEKREQVIEAALVRQMAGGGKKKPADPLRAHQPVTFLGRAIQIPSPVAPHPASRRDVGA